MTYQQLFNRAYALCVKCNQHLIMLDLHTMTESELSGLVIFLTRWQEN